MIEKTHINNKLEGKHNNKTTTKKQKSPSRTLRDIYFSRRFVGWKSCISVCFYVFFSKLFCFFLLLFCFRLVYLSFCMYNGTNTYNNIQTHKKLRDKHKQQKQHKYIISQPEPDKYLFAVGSKAGYLVFTFLFKCVSCVKRYTIIHVTC